MGDALEHVSDVLRHPFVLALFTALSVNGLTRTWQDRQKGIEITAGLVAGMSEATSTALRAAARAVQELHQPTPDPASGPAAAADGERHTRLGALRKARDAWKRDSAVLRTKIEAYFPGRSGAPSLGARWSAFSDEVAASTAKVEHCSVDGQFITAAYNAGPNAITTARREAIKIDRSETTWESLVEGRDRSPLYRRCRPSTRTRR